MASLLSVMASAISLRRNRAFLVKIALFIPLTWLCVFLYVNTAAKNIGAGDADQIVYVTAKVAAVAEESQVVHVAPAKTKTPAATLDKRKPSPSSGGNTCLLKFVQIRTFFGQICTN